jgi:hypothetical protein
MARGSGGGAAWYSTLRVGSTVLVLETLGSVSHYVKMTVTRLLKDRSDASRSTITELTDCTTGDECVEALVVGEAVAAEPPELLPFRTRKDTAEANAALARQQSRDDDATEEEQLDAALVAAATDAEILAGNHDHDDDADNNGDEEAGEQQAAAGGGGGDEDNGGDDGDVIIDLTAGPADPAPDDAAAAAAPAGGAAPAQQAAVLTYSGPSYVDSAGVEHGGEARGSKRARIDHDATHFASSLSALSGYYTKKAQPWLGDFSTDGNTTFLSQDDRPGVMLLASMWDARTGVASLRDVVHISPPHIKAGFEVEYRKATKEGRTTQPTAGEEPWCLPSCRLCKLGVLPLSKAEYSTSGLSFGTILESPQCQREIAQIAALGHHHHAGCATAVDSAWHAAAAILTPAARASPLPMFFSVGLGASRRAGGTPAWAAAVRGRADGRALRCIGAACDLKYDQLFACLCIHSLHSEQHMAKLSKESVKMFGHSFSPEHLFSVIDHKQREKLLSSVPRPTRRALSRLMRDAAARRKAATPGGQGAKSDHAGGKAHIEVQLKKVAIMVTEKKRRQEVGAFLVKAGLSWATMRTRKTGWMWDPKSAASKYIGGGEAAMGLEQVKAEARRLSSASV